MPLLYSLTSNADSPRILVIYLEENGLGGYIVVNLRDRIQMNVTLIKQSWSEMRLMWSEILTRQV